MLLKKVIPLIFISLLFISCESLDNNLSIRRENYNGQELKINGYYHHNINDSLISIRFLNRNGTLFSLGSEKMDDSNKYEEKFKKLEYRERVKNIKFLWGVFKVNGDEIVYEKWYPQSGPKPIIISKGKILNDTTFVITKSISNKGIEKLKNEVYHFKKFSPKMDSITKFIK